MPDNDSSAKNNKSVRTILTNAILTDDVRWNVVTPAVCTFGLSLILGWLTGSILMCCLGLAASAFGFLIGFLFGFPRVSEERVEESKGPDGSVTIRPRYIVNSNLSKISDFVTTGIVGATLINIKEVPLYFTQVVMFMAKGISTKVLTTEMEVRVLVSLALVFFPIAGFLYGYIVTRIYLSKDFYASDSVVSGRESFDASPVT